MAANLVIEYNCCLCYSSYISTIHEVQFYRKCITWIIIPLTFFEMVLIQDGRQIGSSHSNMSPS